MKITNTYISKDCTRKCLVYTDKNGHFEIVRYEMISGIGWASVGEFMAKRKFKHYESMKRAVNKYIK